MTSENALSVSVMYVVTDAVDVGSSGVAYTYEQAREKDADEVMLSKEDWLRIKTSHAALVSALEATLEELVSLLHGEFQTRRNPNPENDSEAVKKAREALALATGTGGGKVK